MTAVSDTTPLNYLIQIDEMDLLHANFGEVLVPAAVFLELQHPSSNASLREWMNRPPSWLVACPVSSNALPALIELHPGEREAILLALERNAEIILMDEAPGRLSAEWFRLEVRGTLEILERGLVSA